MKDRHECSILRQRTGGNACDLDAAMDHPWGLFLLNNELLQVDAWFPRPYIAYRCQKSKASWAVSLA